MIALSDDVSYITFDVQGLDIESVQVGMDYFPKYAIYSYAPNKDDEQRYVLYI